MKKQSAPRAIFKSSGLKTTPHRTMVYQLLEQSQEPLSAKKIFSILSQEDDSLSLSTIYRILEIFAAKKLVARHALQNDSQGLYELARSEHRHFLVCRECRKMKELGSCPFNPLKAQLEKETGFIIEDHQLEVIGLCPDCASLKHS